MKGEVAAISTTARYCPQLSIVALERIVTVTSEMWLHESDFRLLVETAEWLCFDGLLFVEDELIVVIIVEDLKRLFI